MTSRVFTKRPWQRAGHGEKLNYDNSFVLRGALNKLTRHYSFWVVERYQESHCYEPSMLVTEARKMRSWQRGAEEEEERHVYSQHRPLDDPYRSSVIT